MIFEINKSDVDSYGMAYFKMPEIKFLDNESFYFTVFNEFDKKESKINYYFASPHLKEKGFVLEFKEFMDFDVDTFKLTLHYESYGVDGFYKKPIINTGHIIEMVKQNGNDQVLGSKVREYINSFKC